MQNTEVMTTIKLSGSLASLFGREHKRLIGPTREAFRALSATIPGFEKFMNTSNTRGMTFAVFVDKKTSQRMISIFQTVAGQFELFRSLWVASVLVFCKPFLAQFWLSLGFWDQR